jgi:lipoate-protein ligase A
VFCFAAKEKYDILIGGRKIGGSAQKRCRGAIFQHGSIPIAPQPHGASLSDLLGRTVPREELSKILAGSFKETFNITPAEGRLSTREEDILEDLRARKYGSREWNIGRIDATAMKEEHGSRTALVAG